MPLPAPGHQHLPRSVLLAPEGDLLPVRFFRELLKRGRPLALIYQGHALGSGLKHGETFTVDAALPLRMGDLALCESGGLPDVRRLLRKRAGRWLTALDTLPSGREWLADAQLLGRIARPRRFGGRLIARLFPLYSRWAALRLWGRRIGIALDPGGETAGSVQAKYAGQVDHYAAVAGAPMSEFTGLLVRRAVAPPATLLIAGCGAGNEAIGLARAGYQIAAFDLIPAMIEAGMRTAQDAGVAVEFFPADLTTLDLPGRQFDAAYLTPQLYTFIPGRAARIAGLRRLGCQLRPDGVVILSVMFIRGPATWMRHGLVWLRQRLRGNRRTEFGDWYTWYLTPEGRFATAFTRRFTRRQFRAEVRAAGFLQIRDASEGHFILGQFRPAAQSTL
jgi:SAM-dependent methyltransferase